MLACRSASRASELRTESPARCGVLRASRCASTADFEGPKRPPKAFCGPSRYISSPTQIPTPINRILIARPIGFRCLLSLWYRPAGAPGWGGPVCLGLALMRRRCWTPWLLLVSAALAAGLGPLGCAAVRPDSRDGPPPAATPLLWHARAPGGGELYLLGSVHLREVDAQSLGGEIQRAYDASSQLVVEVDLAQATAEDGKASVERYATLPPQLALDSLLSPETRDLLAEYVKERGLPSEQIQRYKPWFVAQLVLVTELQADGYDPAFGVDRVFIDEASSQKEIVGLETISSQFGMLDSLSLELQALMLKDTLLRIDELNDSTRELLEAWAGGDEAELEKQIFAPLEQVPELEAYYDALIWQRNAAMAARLVELSRDGKTRFVVLGAGHMVGS